jgi:hypothetical protein
MQKPTNPLWGFAVLALLGSEFGVTLAQGNVSGAEIVGIFLRPVVAWAIVWLFGHV